MSVAAATTVIGKHKAPAAAATADHRRKVRTAFAFLAPSLVGVVLFLVIPVILVIILSLTQWNLLTPIKFVGFSNYANIFQFDGFGHSLIVTAYYVLLNIPVQTVVALGLALLLNNKLRGSAFIRVMAVLPFLATPVAMGVVWNWFFDPTNGIMNQLLSHVGITGPAWLSDSATAMPIVAFANIWQYAGYNMLFFLAGLQAHPAQPVRGGRPSTGRRQGPQFRRVTLPLLRPALLFVLVTGVIGSFQVFDTVYVMTDGRPGQRDHRGQPQHLQHGVPGVPDRRGLGHVRDVVPDHPGRHRRPVHLLQPAHHLRDRVRSSHGLSRIGDARRHPHPPRRPRTPRPRRGLRLTVFYLVLLVIVIVFITPYLFSLFAAFKPLADILAPVAARPPTSPHLGQLQGRSSPRTTSPGTWATRSWSRSSSRPAR